MRRFLKKVVYRSYLLICLARIVFNLKLVLKRLVGDLSTDSGATHSDLSLQESLTYIEDVFIDYKAVAGIKKFYGRVAEVGPGDSAGVALCFLNDGCEQADLVDRFYSRRNAQTQKKLYEALVKDKPKLKELLKGKDLAHEETFPHLTRYYGPQAAAETFFTTREAYDFIVSRSVLEHVNDPLLSLKKMFNALKPGGHLIHKVDLRDHGMFSVTFHELKFLEVPQLLYTLMTWRSGYPNRILFNQYKDLIKTLGCTHTFLVAQLVGVGPLQSPCKFEEIDPTLKAQAIKYVRHYRNKFAKPFRHISDEDLIVASFFLVAKKAS